MNMTPLRIKVLRFLAERSSYSVKGLVFELCPRVSSGDYPISWTEQGAARMSGKIVKPLEEAGLIATDHFARQYAKEAWITDAGRALLKELDERDSRKQLEDAIEKAT